MPGTDNSAPDIIRKFWMGDIFKSIKVPAKAAARMGQCFSTTHKTVVVDDRDVIRFRGAKGVLSLNSSLQGCKIRLRPSQIKFEASRGKAHQALEVVGLARPVPYYLNRHVILLMSNNGVPEEVFLQKQADMVRRLDAMMKDSRAAEMVLPQLGGVNCLLMLRQMLKGGHSPQDEPLLHQCLLAVRTAALSELRAKARVLVTDGVCLIGAPDETGCLQEGCVFAGSFTSCTRQQRDLPAYHHRQGCGGKASSHAPRDDPNKMSGSDLDGDQYAVTWDPTLMPTKSNQEPMDYTACKPKEVKEVTPNHLLEHFIKFVQNDNLGVIANAWLAHADWVRHQPPYQDIIKVKECTELAILHSTAVDFPKTGEPARLRKDLLPGKVPHWLERKDKDTFKSTSVIGKLYDAVADEQQKVAKDQSNFQALLRAGNTRGPTLPALLKSVDSANTSAWLHFAARLYAAYERSMLELMNRFGVYDEGEMLTGAIKKLNKFRKRKAHDTREAIVQEVQATASRVLRIFLAAILQKQQQQQQPDHYATNHFDEACGALEGPYKDVSTDEMRRSLGWPHPALAGAAACAVYKVTYRELAGADSMEAAESSDESSSSDRGERRSDDRMPRMKREGGQSRPRLLGLPWIVAAEALGA
ncbi:RNA dependent RNA polymerase-domain-containing protein [Dunaliella salina]|uniref:RNA-dependent RNA polymerase n=1 Tax=Dunaliella salina TaxID=3046 RepID=A0ABQ7G4W2_DUNSA|nr:RNA dependent RNA polymerase-domain-containing protein [Dunaliella salina]|eukprot:KAF5829646.1 RNA dependent RNA polymerase-domain-containing protein [Dunaliella salina]